MSDPTPPFDAAAARTHVELIHFLARGIKGDIVVAAYGENATQNDADGKPGRAIPSFVRRYAVGDVDGTLAAVLSQQKRPHSNVYLPYLVMKHDGDRSARGKEADVLAVLALVADMDADHSEKPCPAPFAPSMVVESSPGNTQEIFILDKPLVATDAKPLAAALRRATRSDTGTADISHVWRVPGCLNWPNAAKVARGRPLHPAPVRVSREWTGRRYGESELRTALAPFIVTPAPVAGLQLPGLDDAEPAIDLATLPTDTATLITEGTTGDRSAAFFKVVTSLWAKGHSHHRIFDLLDQHPDGLAAKYGERLEVEINRVCLKAQAEAGRHFDASAGDAGATEELGETEPMLFPDLSNSATLMEDEAATQFAEEYRGKLRFCHSHGAWFLWTGMHWRRERTGLAFHWARELARRMARDQHEKIQVQFGRMAFASAVERGARSDPIFAVTAESWDADPFLLGTPAGTVDLRNGRLRPADPKEGITKTTAVAPADEACCPQWDRFLSEATGSDPELIRFLRMGAGYSLTGDTREHALVFLFGDGGNGKSVFVNNLTGILNDYAVTAAMDTFVATKNDRHSTDLAMLRGARMVTASETEEGRFWAESRIKQLTGGTRLRPDSCAEISSRSGRPSN